MHTEYDDSCDVVVPTCSVTLVYGEPRGSIPVLRVHGPHSSGYRSFQVVHAVMQSCRTWQNKKHFRFPTTPSTPNGPHQ